ncbi:Auxin-induced protein [Macleaya cordata]|uniref:Auxin-induced protein n=1 Tax=Macleaya cordata TaxID=56857 RepID=A0A200Q3N8_MACCD|nr:Auxin-induced protein [Macleaya cordata]OVA06036.1 Auxin-induced protein [Macleaya cordata]
MLKRIDSVKKLAKKVKVMAGNRQSYNYESLVRCDYDEAPTTPTGFFAVYVGEERQRFVVPTSFLSHPLFKMLLEKASDEFGYEQRNGLIVPCTVSTFEEVVSAVECSHGQFDLARLVEEFN